VLEKLSLGWLNHQVKRTRYDKYENSPSVAGGRLSQAPSKEGVLGKTEFRGKGGGEKEGDAGVRFSGSGFGGGSLNQGRLSAGYSDRHLSLKGFWGVEERV